MINSAFLFKGPPSTWTEEEYEEFMEEEFDFLVDREFQPRYINVGGVIHGTVEEFDPIGKTRIEFSHPLGTVYIHEGNGYVQRGYEWLVFDLDKLDDIEK